MSDTNQPPAPEIKRLCDICDGVNDWYTSNEYTKGITLRSVADARRQLECPLCALAINDVFYSYLKYRRHSGLQDVPEDLLCFHIFLQPLRNTPTLAIDVKVKYRNIYKDFYYPGLSFDVLYESFTREQWPYVLRHRLGSIANIGKISGWIEKCRSQHHHRRNPKFERALVGLLEARALKLINTVTLEVCTVRSSPAPAYVALSYVWGQKSQRERNYFEHTTPPSDQNDRKVQLDALPRTLREAISFSRDLGFQHIWIDELCIDQSHSPTKATVIEYMGAIYAAADLVVVAVAGGDSTYGLPGTKDHPRQKEVPLMEALTSQGDYIQFFKCQSSCGEKISSSIWSTRGWTFQEYAFAPRSLFVFSDEMFFDSPSAPFFEREAYTYTKEGPVKTDSCMKSVEGVVVVQNALSASTTPRWVNYCQIISSYTMRHLKFENDRVTALRGILSEAFGHDDNIALQTGLPMCYFGLALTWQLPSSEMVESGMIRRHPAQDIPSWSWGSAGWPVRYEEYRYPYSSQHHPFTYKQTSVHAVLGRPLGTLLWRNFGWPIDTETMRSFLQSPIQSPILESGQPFPIIHLMTLTAHAHLQPIDEESSIMAYKILRSLPRKVDIIYNDMFLVDKAKFGHLDVTRPWRLAVVWTIWEDRTFSLAPPLHWALLLRKVGEYHERVSIGIISNATLVGRGAAWDYIKLR